MRAALDWSNLGDQVFQVGGSERKEVLMGLRMLISRLGMAPRFENLRRECLGSGGPSGGQRGERFGRPPRAVLLYMLMDNLRLNGYVYQAGRLWRETPLTPRQLHIVRLISQGKTLKAVGHDFGISAHTTAQILGQAMNDLGCKSQVHLASTVFYRGWLPGEEERSEILNRLGPDLSRGYIILPADQA